MSCCGSKAAEEQREDECCAPKEKKCCAPKDGASAIKRITRETTIDAILTSFPQKAPRLSQAIAEAGLSCSGCHAATYETLEGGMYGHGMTDAEIDNLVTVLNGILDEEELPRDTIALTPRAAKKYLLILAEEGKQGWGLRFFERAAGCSGFEYALDYSEKALPDDVIFFSHGVEIHVSKAIVDQLMGSLIDYVEGLKGSGFKVSNPNVRSSCGCGTSHGY